VSPALPRATRVVLIAALFATEGAWAQDPPAKGTTLPGAAWKALSDSSRSAWVWPTASFVLPGTGQLLGGSERGALYLVAEVFLVARFLSLEHDAHQEARQYRDLAFSVARSAFAPQSRDTVWGYYEAMGEYIESGRFSQSSGPDVVPPEDFRTFNGHIWQLARQTFFANPDSVPDPASSAYQAAMSFYRRRAVGPNFQWSWRGAAIEQDLYRQAIHSSDEAFREARTQLGLLLANHVLSAIDAVVTNRLSQRHRRSGAPGHLRIVTSGSGQAVQLQLTLGATF
jgi:hypothetical protein